MAYNPYFNSWAADSSTQNLSDTIVTQLNNIGGVNISSSQWSYLGDLDQYVSADTAVIHTSISDGVATLTGGELSNATNIMAMGMTGFHEWAAGAGDYWSIDAATFTVLRSCTGYIKSNLVTFTAPQSQTLVQFDSNVIYIDSAGDLQITNTKSQSLYLNNIVLFEVFYNGSTFVRKENHPCCFQNAISHYLHFSVGGIVTGAGGNIEAVATNNGLKITANAVLRDHGLESTITGSESAISIQYLYINGAGNWIIDSTSTTMIYKFASSGSPINLTAANKFGVYRIYSILDDINSDTPQYVAVMHTDEFGSANSITNAIENGEIQAATGALDNMEPIQLGYVIFQLSGINDVIVAKNTLNERYTGGGSANNHLLLSDLNAGTYSMGGHTGMVQRHLVAADPTANDDSASYLGACNWLNTSSSELFTATDTTPSGAVWRKYAFQGQEITATNLVCDTINTTISSTELGFINGLDQNLTTTSDVVFNSLNTITASEIAYLDNLNQFLTTTSDVTFNNLTISTGITLPGTVNVDTINEKTADNGVVIESVKFKDDSIFAGSTIIRIGLGTSGIVGNYNIGIGSGALGSMSTGLSTVGLGAGAGASSNNAYSLFLGDSANCSTSAENQIAIGYSSSVKYTNSLACGHQAKAGIYDVSIGYQAGSVTAHPTTGGNISIGKNTGDALIYSSNTDASENVFIGYETASACTIGAFNTVVGARAGGGLIGGISNTFVGSTAGGTIASTSSNVCIGSGSDGVATSAEIVAIGVQASSSGNQSVSVGRLATSASNSVAIGYSANCTNADSVCVGDNSNCSGTDGISIGRDSNAAYNSSIAIGAALVTSATLQCRISHIYGRSTAGDGIAVYVDSSNTLGTSVSSLRFKENIRPITSEDCEFLYKMKVRKFDRKQDVYPPVPNKDEIGFIAEELHEICPQHTIYDKEGLPLTYNKDCFVPHLIHEVQRLDSIVKQQDVIIKNMGSRLYKLEKLLHNSIVYEAPELELPHTPRASSYSDLPASPRAERGRISDLRRNFE